MIIRLELVIRAERPGAGEILARPHQLGDLPDVPEVVQGPFVQHLGQRNLPGRAMHRLALARFGGKPTEQLDVSFALVLEMAEVLFGIGVLVNVEVHLRVVGLELWHLLAQEAVDARAITMPLAVRQVREHLRDREAIRRGLPARVLVRDFAHETAQDCRRGFQEVEAGQHVAHQDYPTMLSPPSTRKVFPVMRRCDPA